MCRAGTPILPPMALPARSRLDPSHGSPAREGRPLANGEHMTMGV